MIKLSRLTDYAVVVLSHLAAAPGRDMPGPAGVRTSPDIAAATGVPEPTVAKVLKCLALAGLVEARRGAKGGYRTPRAAGAISIAEVIAAIDGPISLTLCVDGLGACEASLLCPLHGKWDRVNRAVREALAAVSLADLLATPVDRKVLADAGHS